ncbi:MAG: hypothetical protein ACLU9S_01565 [Oscillospiraceae bacterium]
MDDERGTHRAGHGDAGTQLSHVSGGRPGPAAGRCGRPSWRRNTGTDHRRDILPIVDGSFLEEYDEYNIEVQFKSTAAVSITYALMSRCGLEPEQYFSHEDFMRDLRLQHPRHRRGAGHGGQPDKPAGTAADRRHHPEL